MRVKCRATDNSHSYSVYSTLTQLFIETIQIYLILLLMVNLAMNFDSGKDPVSIAGFRMNLILTVFYLLSLPILSMSTGRTYPKISVKNGLLIVSQPFFIIAIDDIQDIVIDSPKPFLVIKTQGKDQKLFTINEPNLIKEFYTHLKQDIF